MPAAPAPAPPSPPPRPTPGLPARSPAPHRALRDRSRGGPTRGCACSCTGTCVGTGGDSAPQSHAQGEVAQAAPMGAPAVGGHPQPPVRGPGLAPASALGPPLPADAVFPAPARDTPAARRPPGVWHSRASAVSRQQPPAGAQRSSGWHPWGCGPGAQPEADNRPQTCARQRGVHTRVHLHKGLHAARRLHARTRRGKAACGSGGDEEQRVGVQGAGCARGWCAAGLRPWVCAGPRGVTGGPWEPRLSPPWVLPDAPSAAGAGLAGLGGTRSNPPAPTGPAWVGASLPL